MSFGIYLLGFVIMIVGLGIGANMLGLAPRWILVGAIVLLGIGVLSAVTHTRMRDKV